MKTNKLAHLPKTATFAGFGFPKPRWTLPKGDMLSRLAAAKKPAFTGGYYHALGDNPGNPGEYVSGYWKEEGTAFDSRRMVMDESDAYSWDDVDAWYPCLWALPHGKFLAGCTMGDGMITEFARVLHASENEAWHNARRMAQETVQREVNAMEEAEELNKHAEIESIQNFCKQGVDHLVNVWNATQSGAETILEAIEGGNAADIIEAWEEEVDRLWRVVDGKYVTIVKDSDYMEHCPWVEKAEDLPEKLEVQIPFPGFYNTFIGEEPVSAHNRYNEWREENGEEPLREPDWHKVNQVIVKSWVENFLRDCGMDLASLKTALKTVSVDSPREYNYRTDRVFVTVPAGFMADLLAKVDKKELCNVVKSHCESRSGFVSSYPSDYWKWPSIKSWDHNHAHLVLQAYMLQALDAESITDLELRYLDGFLGEVISNAVAGCYYD